MEVQYKDQKKKLIFVIIEGNGPALLGRDWLMHITINWADISTVHSTPKMSQLLNEYSELFEDKRNCQRFYVTPGIQGILQSKVFLSSFSAIRDL